MVIRTPLTTEHQKNTAITFQIFIVSKLYYIKNTVNGYTRSTPVPPLQGLHVQIISLSHSPFAELRLYNYYFEDVLSLRQLPVSTTCLNNKAGPRLA